MISASELRPMSTGSAGTSGAVVVTRPPEPEVPPAAADDDEFLSFAIAVLRDVIGDMTESLVKGIGPELSNAGSTDAAVEGDVDAMVAATTSGGSPPLTITDSASFTRSELLPAPAAAAAVGEGTANGTIAGAPAEGTGTIDETGIAATAPAGMRSDARGGERMDTEVSCNPAGAPTEGISDGRGPDSKLGCAIKKPRGRAGGREPVAVIEAVVAAAAAAFTGCMSVLVMKLG